MTDQEKAIEEASRFYHSLKSLHEFDTEEVSKHIDALINPSVEEQCYVATYKRTRANVGSLLELKGVEHFQAINMISRAIFELAIDIKLLGIIERGPEKMAAQPDVEKVRIAWKIVAFSKSNPTVKIDSIYSEYLASETTRIEAKRAELWPTTKTKDLEHWSNLKMKQRVALLKAPFDYRYVVHYPRLSWQSHSGLTGVINLEAVTFTRMCSIATNHAVESYMHVLQVVIQKFNLDKITPDIIERMGLAKGLPFHDLVAKTQD